MEYKKLLDLVINICKEMLICGAEISRVEDTATRIFNSYNISEVNVFTITSCIIITIKNNQSIYTQTKRKFNYIDANIALLTMIIAFLIGLFAVLFVKIGFGKDLDNIVIGNIMLMIPGVAITNSLRDMISGDTMSGLLRFVESIIKAIAVTLGFVFATAYLGKFIL